MQRTVGWNYNNQSLEEAGERGGGGEVTQKSAT